MSTQPTPTPAKTTDWAAMILFVLLSGGAVYALYYAFTAQAEMNRHIAQVQRHAAGQIRALQQAQHNGTADTSIAQLGQQLAASQQQVAMLTERLAILEKTANTPAPTISFTTPPATNTAILQRFAALKQALSSGQPYARALADAAAIPEVAAVHERLAPGAKNGLASEPALRAQLAAALAEHRPAAPSEDPRFARINHTLNGMLHIRPAQNATPDAYAILRAQAEAGAALDLLLISSAQLPAEAQAPLAEWQAQAQARHDAMAALAAAEIALAQPQAP